MTPTEGVPPLSRRRRWSVWLAWGLIAVGVLLHLTLRDAWQWPTAALFYALPRPVLAAIAVLAAGLARLLSRRESRVSLIVATIMLGCVGYRDIRWTNPPTAQSQGRPLRVVVWNAAHLARGREAAAAWIREWDADIIGIVEAGPTYPGDIKDWKRLLPGYAIASPRLQSLILARGDVQLHDVVSLGFDSDAMPATVIVEDTACEVVLVDIVSNIRLGRSGPLRKLARMLDEAPARPQIVMGDFNTPPESVWLHPLREQYRDAFDVAGRGYQPTWPLPVPSLKLDYVWVAPGVTVEQCHHGWTTASDHRPVFVTLKTATTATVSPDSTLP